MRMRVGASYDFVLNYYSFRVVVFIFRNLYFVIYEKRLMEN